MKQCLSKLVAGVAVACMSSAPIAVWAQSPDTVDATYCRGVDAFFAGRSGEADACLSHVIGSNADDPRPFYFRALSRLRQGRSVEASADMQIGAELEARMPNRFAIGRVLERVQGPDRLLLERYRRAARTTAAMAVQPAVATLPSRRLPTAGQPDADAAVLRERRYVPLDEFLQSGAPRSYAVVDELPASKTPTAPAAVATTPAAKQAEVQKAAPEPVVDPFADEGTHPAAKEKPAAKAPTPPAAKPKLPVPPPPSQPVEKRPVDDSNPFQ